MSLYVALVVIFVRSLSGPCGIDQAEDELRGCLNYSKSNNKQSMEKWIEVKILELSKSTINGSGKETILMHLRQKLICGGKGGPPTWFRTGALYETGAL